MGNNNSYNKIYIGVVKDNNDFQNMGRLSVSIPELVTIGGSIIVSYASPFIGSTDPEQIDKENTETFEGTQTSYGFWAVPPTINSQVLIAFVNGEPSRGYWFACISQPFMNHMIPNIPVGDSYQYDGELVPVAEFNKASTVPNKHKGKRPFHKLHYETVRKQGLKKDKIRGFSQNGGVSGIPSKVMGMLTPKGHYWSMEDTDEDEKVRIRTKSGIQLLLDDTNGLVYVINKSGTGWIEINDTGKVMVYGESSIALRTKTDFSVRADRDIIFESGRNTYIHALGDIKVQTNNILNNVKEKFVVSAVDDITLSGNNLHVDIVTDTQLMAGGNVNIGAGGNGNILTTGDCNISGNNVNVGANANAVISGNAQASLSGNAGVTVAAGGPLGLGGAVLNMNMGAAFVGAGPAESAAPVAVVPEDFVFFDKVDVTQPDSDDEPTVEAFPTIVTTLPTHEPCQEHDAEPEDLG